jgi:hypothetical protein
MRHKLLKYAPGASKLVSYEFYIETQVFSDPKNVSMNDCFLTPCSHNQSLIKIVITGHTIHILVVH